jgi:hypothetical protein
MNFEVNTTGAEFLNMEDVGYHRYPYNIGNEMPHLPTLYRSRITHVTIPNRNLKVPKREIFDGVFFA